MINYYEEFKKQIKQIEKQNEKPVLLLHVCCAPCSSGCIEMLQTIFKVKVLFYNPNISPTSEYDKRKQELKRFVEQNENLLDVEIINCEYENEKYKNAVVGLEQEREGGKRCEECFKLRLEKSAQICKQINADYFTTTLTISPLKNANLLNEIGLQLAEKYGVKFLCSNFKKQDGYKKSIENSKKYNLYRQDYCGCIYSKLEREKIKKENELV